MKPTAWELNSVPQNIKKVNKSNSAELVEDGAITNTFNLSITRHKRGMLIYTSNAKYNATVFADNETNFMKDIIFNLIDSWLRKSITAKQADKKLTCTSCNNDAVNMVGSSWVCSNCGYKTKHYGVENND